MRQQVLWITLIGLVAIGYAGKYSGDQVLRIVPATDLQVKLLLRLQEQDPLRYDFWTFPGNAGMPVDIHVKSLDCANFTKFLNNKKMKYEVISPDVQKLLDQQDDHPHYADAREESWFVKYHPFNEIINKTRRIAALSNMATEVEIGKSYEGREQLAVKISNQKMEGSRPMFFINCGIHAREWVSPATCVYIIEQLVTKYGKDPTVTRTLDKMDFTILPVLNPDGYTYTWKGDGNRFWRKNRNPANDGSACVGVDLNRNFRYGWGKDVEGVESKNPCSDIYRGIGPESEKEVKNVADHLRSLKDKLKAYMDIHSYSQMWMLPWGYTTDPPQDYEELLKVGKIGAEAIKEEIGATYTVGSSSKLLYRTSGTTKDFAYGELGVKYSYVLELRDKGKFGFVLPTSQILPTVIEIFSGIKAMVAAMEDFSNEP